MTYAFTHMGNFLLLLLLLLLLLRTLPLPPASRPISQPGGPYSSLEAQIPVLRPKSLETGIWALGLGFRPRGWDMGLQAEIWAWRQGEGGTEKKEEEEEKEEKIAHMYESIGHRPLRGRCPKTEGGSQNR